MFNFFGHILTILGVFTYFNIAKKLYLKNLNSFQNVIILNKTDLVDASAVGLLKAFILKLNPNAKIITSDFSRVSPKEILNTNLFDFEEASIGMGPKVPIIRTQLGVAGNAGARKPGLNRRNPVPCWPNRWMAYDDSFQFFPSCPVKYPLRISFANGIDLYTEMRSRPQCSVALQRVAERQDFV